MAALLLVALSLLQVSADQPVNCLRQNFHESVWNFYVSQDNQTINLFEQREVCSHSIPNRVQVIGHDFHFAFQKQDLWQLTIKPDYTAEGKYCKDGNTQSCDQTKIKGKWMTFYDQAFFVYLDNGLQFVANFRYEIKQNVTNDPVHYDFKKLEKLVPDTDTSTKAQFASICNETMAGFVFNQNTEGTLKNHSVTCFYGKRDNWEPMAAAQKTIPKDQSNLLIEEQAQVQHTVAHHQRRKSRNLFAKHKPSAESDRRIMEINNNDQLPWQANTCMLSSDHPSFSCDEESGSQEASLLQVQNATINKATASKDGVFQFNITVAPDSKGAAKSGDQALQKMKKELEQNVKDGMRKKKQLDGPKEKNKNSGQALNPNATGFDQAVAAAQGWHQKYKDADEVPDTLVPDAYDFRNISGFDFTGKLRDQGGCGSCYTMGFIQQIEARMNLKYGHLGKQPSLSPQFMMQCNYLNEGCEGGWAMLHGLFAEHGHLVTDKCAKYDEKTKGHSCNEYKACPGYAKVKESYYVNGYNYKPTVQQIQKEMLLNGPLTAEIKCYDDFQFYKSGVLIQTRKEPEDMEIDGKKQPKTGKGEGIVSQIEMTQVKAESELKSEAFVAQKMADQPLDHTVFLIGWGHDKKSGLDYWIVRNSYGDKWGMNGDFLVRRGHDDWGIESELSGYKVELLEQQEKEKTK